MHVGLFSDGLQMLALKLADHSPHTPFFAPLFNFMAKIENKEEA